jgi:hypothetical protein
VVAAEVVRYAKWEVQAVMGALGSEHLTMLPVYEVRIVDGIGQLCVLGERCFSHCGFPKPRRLD